MHTGKSLTVQNDEIKEGTQIIQSDYQGKDSQKWILRDSHKNGWIISSFVNSDLSNVEKLNSFASQIKAISEQTNWTWQALRDQKVQIE